MTVSRFTSASDVWSFFVVLWEVWSRGQTPFGVQSNRMVVMALEGVAECSGARARPGVPELDGPIPGAHVLSWIMDPPAQSIAQVQLGHPKAFWEQFCATRWTIKAALEPGAGATGTP